MRPEIFYPETQPPDGMKVATVFIVNFIGREYILLHAIPSPGEMIVQLLPCQG
jgi:hypothetical protein